MRQISYNPHPYQRLVLQLQLVPLVAFQNQIYQLEKYQESNEQDLFRCIKSTNEIIVKSIQENNKDDSDVFGQLIVIELRKLSEYKRDMAKKKNTRRHY